MATTHKTWSDLLERLERLHATGRVVEGAISFISVGEATVFYPDSVLKDLSTWIRDAHQLALHDRRESVVADLREAVSEWTKSGREKTLYEAGEKLCMGDFREMIEIETFDRDPKTGKLCTRPTSIEDYADPLDTRFRLQGLIADLLTIARFAASASSVSSVDTLNGRRHCTREELAEALGIKPATITKWITAHRRAKGGKDPIWVRRLPGKQRGFLVLVPTFIAEFRAGRAG